MKLSPAFQHFPQTAAWLNINPHDPFQGVGGTLADPARDVFHNFPRVLMGWMGPRSDT